MIIILMLLYRFIFHYVVYSNPNHLVSFEHSLGRSNDPGLYAISGLRRDQGNTYRPPGPGLLQRTLPEV